MTTTTNPVNDVGDLLRYLQEQTLPMQQKAAGKSADGTLLKKQSDVVEKLRADLAKVAKEIDKKQLAGSLALNAGLQSYQLLLTSLENKGFGAEDRSRLNSVMVTIDHDIESLKKDVKTAQRNKVRAENKHKRALQDEEIAKVALEEAKAKLIGLPKAVQDLIDAISQLSDKTTDGLQATNLIDASIYLTDMKVQLDAGENLPGQSDDAGGAKPRKYPLPGYEALDRLIEDDYENDLVDRIIKDLPPVGDQETHIPEPTDERGLLKRYLGAMQTTSDALSELEQAKVALKTYEERLKALQAERIEKIKSRYAELTSRLPAQSQGTTPPATPA